MMRAMLVAVCLLVAGAAVAAEDLTVLPVPSDGVAPQEMMHAYLVDRAQKAFDRRDAEYEKIKTPEDVAAYQERMRQFFVAQLGGFPERTPLNPQVVAKEDRAGYRIEKIIFESQPKHYVTAVLYLPNAEPPYPGVLVPCGHSHNGKARDLYQRAPILMALNGMAALCYDPIDQGERHQLVGADGVPIISGSTMGHCLTGVGATLVGRNTATYRIWDGMRAIDYLQSRKEIDPERIGCTGISGGGTLTSYLMALDGRIKAAAPGCYLTTFRRLLETIGPQDAEQNIHAQIAFGMDHADYVMMRAPKATLIMAATRDYFDIGGAWDNFRQAKRLYTRLALPERVDLFETDTKHGFPQPMREAACRWMRRWLLGVDDAITEPDFPVATDDEMRCTPRGEVMLLPGARSVYDLNVELEERLAEARKKFWQQTGKQQALDEVRRITGIRPLGDLPEPKSEKTGTLQREGYRIDKLILRPEPGIALPALAFVPEKPDGEATLYLHAAGKQTDAGEGGGIEKLVRAGQVVLAADLRGLGETQDVRKHGFTPYLGAEWREIYLAYMLDTSYLAMRAEDVLVLARFLTRYEAGDGPNRVHLASIGRTGPPALHAAALQPELFASIRLQASLVSWSNVLRTPMAKNQLINVVHGALRTYDLPDLLSTLPADKVVVVHPVDATEEAQWSSVLFDTIVGVCQSAERQPAATARATVPTFGVKTLDQWIALSKDKDPAVRIEAAAALGNIGPAAVPALTALLEDKDWRVRVNAVARIPHYGPNARSAIPALTRLLRDKAWQVRMNAAAALYGFGPEAKTSIPALTELLRDTEGSVRSAAVMALGRMGPDAKDTVPALTELLRDKDSLVRVAAALALRDLDAETGIRALAGLLADSDWEPRYMVAMYLGAMGPKAKAAIPALAKSLADEHPYVRSAAAYALENIKTDKK